MRKAIPVVPVRGKIEASVPHMNVVSFVTVAVKFTCEALKLKSQHKTCCKSRRIEGINISRQILFDKMGADMMPMWDQLEIILFF